MSLLIFFFFRLKASNDPVTELIYTHSPTWRGNAGVTTEGDMGMQRRPIRILFLKESSTRSPMHHYSMAMHQMPHIS